MPREAMTAREFYERNKETWAVYRWDYDSALFRFVEAYAKHVREQALEEAAADAERYVDAVKVWRAAMLDAWAKDHRATMTALLESGRPSWEALKGKHS